MELEPYTGNMSDASEGDDSLASVPGVHIHQHWRGNQSSQGYWNCENGYNIRRPISVQHPQNAPCRGLGDFEKYASVLDRLHCLLAKQPFEQQTLVDYETILKAISAWITTDRARIIARNLQKYFDDYNVQATALRVSVLFPFPNDSRTWLVMEWKQECDKDVLAIFHFDEKTGRQGRYSWLAHGGAGASGNEPRWKESTVAWSVMDMSHLKTLFGAAQHFLGILEMDHVDAMRLYCENEPTDCSEEEMIHYATLLYIHIHQIELIEAEFDKVVSALCKMSNEEGKTHLSVKIS